MIKKIIGVGMIASALLLATSVLAEDTNTGATPAPTTTIITPSTAVSCVAAAVATREASLGNAIMSYTSSVNGAYNTRAASLASAYQAGTNAQIKVAIRASWKDFRSAMSSANKTWKTAKNAAWATFRSAARACKAHSSINDNANSGFEAMGQ